MARRRALENTAPEHDDVVAWYRERLTAEAVISPGRRVLIGPTWQTTREGRWLLPDATLGWDVLGWCGTDLQHSPGKPWRFTLEQARFTLWWFSLEESGDFTFHDGVLQRLKGWGKDPVGACYSYVEAFGPSRFAGWDGDSPLATDCPGAWVQLAAVALEQTKNTTRLFPGLIQAEARRRYRLQIGKELIHGLGDERLIQAVTSSPATLEGARATFVLRNETQHWGPSNAGYEMADVIERNATKSPGGAARTLAITNAYDPAEDSVAQRDREAWELAEAGQSLTTGILYDSIEAPADAPLTAEAAPGVVEAIRGDSIWLSTNRIVKSILDTRNPPSRSRRWWYNQIWATEDAWVVPQDFDLCVRELELGERDEVVLFFDGSKSDDATALVAARISDGHVVTLGMWQRPPGERGIGWVVPRADVDAAVELAFVRFQVRAFFADPSHALDDETQERFWDGLIDEWHRRYRDQLTLWAMPTKHSILWDMTSPKRSEAFTHAAERCASEIGEHTLTHDGDRRLRIHVRNARRYPNRWGVSLWKGHRESPRKIDLAVAMVGARMVRRDLLNAKPQRDHSGIVVGV